MHTIQLKIRTPRIRDLAPIATRQRMPTPKNIIHMTRRSLVVRRAIERDDTARAAICITTLGLAIPDIFDAIPDVLIVAGETVLKTNIEGLHRAISPWLIVGHASPADSDHGAIAGSWVRLAPASAAHAALGILILFAVDAVEAVCAVEPSEVGYSPGWDGTTFGGADGGG